MKVSDVRRLATIVILALCFGVALSVVKGNGGGVRAAIGNTSAPWLLLAFFAGAYGRGRRAGPGAAVGLLATFTALAGFYIADTQVLDLGPHTLPVDLRLTIEAGREYFVLALVSGPTLGALGALWQRQRSVLLGVSVTALLILEPLAWLLYEHSSPAHFTTYPTVWLVEVAVGVVACALVGTRLRPHGRQPHKPVE